MTPSALITAEGRSIELKSIKKQFKINRFLFLFDYALKGFNRSWASEECLFGLFWMSWGTLGRPFGRLGVALGVHFGGQEGVPLDAFGAQSLQKTPSPFFGRLVLSDFGAAREPTRLPKWS